MGNFLLNTTDKNLPVKRTNSFKKCYWCNLSPIIFRIARYNYCENCYTKEKKRICEYEMKSVGVPEIDQITDKIYLGNSDASKNYEILKRNNITHVLVCGYFLPEFFPNDFVYKTIALEDSLNQDIYKFFKECFKFIDSSKKVFVHCRAGISRSSTIVIAYLMWSKRKSFFEAKKFVKERRKCIAPNPGFISQLKDFEEELRKNDY